MLPTLPEGMADPGGVLRPCTAEVAGAVDHLADVAGITLYLELMPDAGASSLDDAVTQDELDWVIQDDMRPAAQAGDWCAATLAFLTLYEQAVTEDVVARPSPA
jgi:hypothetical protein